MRYEDLTDEELQAKAEEMGVENAGSLTRDQLIVALAEKGDEGVSQPANEVPEEEIVEDTSMADRGAFTTPLEEQGSDPMGADEGERNVPSVDDAATGELAPVEGEQADQASLGGTGGTTTAGLGNSGGNA